MTPTNTPSTIHSENEFSRDPFAASQRQRLRCTGCSCSELAPCVDAETGETCAWVECDEGPLCSFCAEAAAPLIETFSEAEANHYLRTRRAGA